MAGEFLREAGLLVAVFMPLDLVVQNHPVTIAWGATMVALPLALLGAGVAIERRRRT